MGSGVQNKMLSVMMVITRSKLMRRKLSATNMGNGHVAHHSSITRTSSTQTPQGKSVHQSILSTGLSVKFHCRRVMESVVGSRGKHLLRLLSLMEVLLGLRIVRLVVQS